MSSRRKAIRRGQLERNLKKYRSSQQLRPVSGRVRAATRTPPPPPEPDPYQCLLPTEGAGAEIQALREEVSNLKRLQEVIHFLGGAPDLTTLRGELLDLAISLSGLRRGMLALPSPSDDGSRRFRIKVKRGFDDPKVKNAPETKVLRNILNGCLESRESLLEGNIRELQDGGILGHSNCGSLKLGAVACFPLQAGGQILGAFLVDAPDRRAPFSPAEEHLLRSFARHAAVAISRVAHQSRLKRQAALLQRRNERLEAEAEAQVRKPHKPARSSSRLERATRGNDPAGQELRRLLGKDYAGAKRSFTRRYLATVLREAGGDIRRASERTGLPLARLIGLLDHLGIDGRS